jgi:hypothetical protein
MSFIAFWQDKVPSIASPLGKNTGMRLWVMLAPYWIQWQTIVGAIPFSICFELWATFMYVGKKLHGQYTFHFILFSFSFFREVFFFYWSLKDKIELVSYAWKYSATQWDNSRAAHAQTSSSKRPVGTGR